MIDPWFVLAVVALTVVVGFVCRRIGAGTLDELVLVADAILAPQEEES